MYIWKKNLLHYLLKYWWPLPIIIIPLGIIIPFVIIPWVWGMIKPNPFGDIIPFEGIIIPPKLGPVIIMLLLDGVIPWVCGIISPNPWGVIMPLGDIIPPPQNGIIMPAPVCDDIIPFGIITPVWCCRWFITFWLVPWTVNAELGLPGDDWFGLDFFFELGELGWLIFSNSATLFVNFSKFASINFDFRSKRAFDALNFSSWAVRSFLSFNNFASFSLYSKMSHEENYLSETIRQKYLYQHAFAGLEIQWMLFFLQVSAI